ncbi:unnamed protein product [Calypogeia fissa]
MPAGTVEVFLIGAVGIKDTEVFGKADPYAFLICGKQKLRSNTASNQGSKPSWNQKFSFYIDDNATDLQIKIFNHNIIKEDDELGSTLIPLTKVFADGKLPTTSYNVVRPSGRVQGEVKLSISFTPKQRSTNQTVMDIPGPYNAKVHGSPYAATLSEPKVKHDPLIGPNGYYRNNSSTSPSAHEGKSHSFSSNSNPGAIRPYPPEVNTYPPSAYPPVPSMNDPYQRAESSLSYQHADSFSSSSDGSSHGRTYPVTPSTSTDYTESIYVQSPYGQRIPRPAPPPGLSSASHHGAPSMASAPTAYPPPGGHGPSYSSGSSTNSGGANKFRFDELAGNFGSLKISGNGGESSSHGGHPGYQSTQSFSDHKPAGWYPPSESVSGHYDHPPNGRPADGYPPSVYPGAGYPPQYDNSHGGFPRPGPYSLYGYEAPPPSFYPQQLGVSQHPQHPYGIPHVEDSPSSNPYPPANYYNAPPAQYVPAGYPK